MYGLAGGEDPPGGVTVFDAFQSGAAKSSTP